MSSKEEEYFVVGVSAVVTALALSWGATWVVNAYMSGKEKLLGIELETAKVEKGYILQERDLNNNALPELFYEIDGKKVFLSVDCKSIEDTLGQ